MHGGPPSALVGVLATEEVREDEQVARVQIDLERPVPLKPLTGLVRRRQVSPRVSHLAIELSTEEGRAVSARVLLTRRQTLSLAIDEWTPPKQPEQLPLVDWTHLYPTSNPSFVRQAVEHRIVRGGYGVPEPSAAWLRLEVPVIEGVESCGLSQLLAVADFGSPLSQTPVGPGLALINLDVNVTVFRQPMAPWFLLEARGRVGDAGTGLAVTEISDLEGPIGVITQTQIVRRYAGGG
jgi:hypothetical protein